MALENYFDTDPDFFLEELQVERHLRDYHRIWSDAASLIWSTQAPKKTFDETRDWLRRWTKEADPLIENYAIMLRCESPLNPTNPESMYAPPASIGDGESSLPRPFLIGQVGILRPARFASSKQESTSSPEMGYMIHHTHWGLGLASRAVRVFVAGYWAVLNPPQQPRSEILEVIEAHIDPANRASEQIAKRLGLLPGEEAGEEFRLASTAELRKLRIWRLRRPSDDDGSPGDGEARK